MANIGYTSDVDKVIAYANAYAKENGISVYTELLLGGMLMVEDCYAAEILNKLKVDKDTVLGMIPKVNALSNQAIAIDQTRRALSFAATFAEKSGYTLYDTHHLLLAVSYDKNCGAARILAKFNIDFNTLKPIVESMTANGVGKNNDADEGDDLIRMITDFFGGALGNTRTGGRGGASANPLDGFKINIQSNNNAQPPKKPKEGEGDELNEELAGFGYDMTARARDGKFDPVIGREKEIEQIMRVLTRRTKNNPMVIGEPGVGKTAVVEGLAQAIVAGKVPELLKNKKIFALDIGSLVAGTKYRGEFEERFKKMLQNLDDGKTILFIDEIHMIMSVGDNDGGATVANLLKPLLARGEIPTIGATTMEEYRKYIEKDAALERRFKPIVVDPPSVADSITILKGLRDQYQNHHKVTITDEAIVAAVTLTDRYVADRYLPDKAIDVIDEAASKMRVSALVSPPELTELEKQRELLNESIVQATKSEDFVKASTLKNERDDIDNQIKELKLKWGNSIVHGQVSIGEKEIAEIVSEWSKVPVNSITAEESAKLLNLEHDLKERVIGQDEAVAAVARAVKRGRAGLKDNKKPIGTFMFLGPTGVGKTELTKALAEKMFGDENMLIRIDMSEYMEKDSVSKLIGSPPGYVGYDDGGQLTEKVRRKPYSVVLFDEIEKANSDVFNLLLQVLDDGRLTDSHGRLVSFKNTVIIMTSNIGASEISSMKQVGFGEMADSNSYENMKDKQMAALKKKMPPEFINRIDDIIIFRKLDEASLEKIAAILIKQLTKILDTKNIKMSYTPAVLKYILDNGTDLEYGARPLKRAIQRIFEDKLSEEIISGRLTNDCTVTADIKDGEVVFEVTK